MNRRESRWAELRAVGSVVRRVGRQRESNYERSNVQSEVEYYDSVSFGGGARSRGTALMLMSESFIG